MMEFLSKLSIVVGGLIGLLILILIWLAWPTLQAIAPAAIYTAAGIAGLAGLAWLVAFVLRQWFVTRGVAAKSAAYQAENQLTVVRSKAEADRERLGVKRLALHIEAEKALLRAQIHQMQAGLVSLDALGEARFKQFTTGSAKLAGNALPASSETMPPLLEAIGDLQNLLIVGGKGSGKTTLLQHIEAERASQHQTIILDSHAQQGQWRGQVFGIRRQYRDIKNAMVGLVNELNNRYQLWPSGNAEFEPITSFIDEFTLLPGTLKDYCDFDVQQFSKPILTEGRKIRINTCWGVHSDRVEALGLKGAGDLRECFDAVVYLHNVRGDRYATVDFGDGHDKSRRYAHPGPFVVAGQAVEVAAPPSIFNLPVSDPEPDKPSAEDMAIIEAFYQVKESNGGRVVWRQVCEALGQSPGGAQVDAIRAVLDRWGIDYQ